jgi:segregation and condensation protein B
MEFEQLKAAVEAMIFVSDEPLNEQSMLTALEPDRVEKASLKEAIEAIRKSWNEDLSCGLKLAEVAGGYEFRTKEEVSVWAKRLFAAKPIRLSQPSLETLAIIAYRQPITRSEIEQIRGVDCGGVLKTLLDRKLIKIVGKRDEPGQPLIYGTAKEFLETFNLPSLRELPALTDLKDMARRREEDDVSQVNIFGMTGDDESGEENEEEHTAVIEEDEEEPTEVLSRIEEENEEDRDALANLENSLKSLRKMEKVMFPKPVPKVEPAAEGQENANEQGEATATPTQSEAASPTATAEQTDPTEEGSPQQVDRGNE